MRGLRFGNKGQTFYILIFATIIVIFVLIIIFGNLASIMKGASHAKICEYSLFVTAATKTPIIQNINIPPECQMKRVTLTYDDLAKDKNRAKKEILKHNEKYKDNPFSYNPDTTKDEVIKYEMDKALAKELKSCWQIGWQGNFNFFDEWWKFYELPWEDEIRNQEKAWDAWITKFTGSPLRPPVNCIACARVKFDDELQRRFSGENLKSINEWMQKTPVPADPQQLSYWEYTLPDQSLESIYKAGERFSYDIDKPYLIAFARINVHRVTDAVAWTAETLNLIEDVPEDMSTLLLIPYEDANKYCTFIIG